MNEKLQKATTLSQQRESELEKMKQQLESANRVKLDLQNQLTSVQERTREIKPEEGSSSKDRPTSRLITEVHTSEENTKRGPAEDDLVTTAQAMDIREMHIDGR